MVEEEQRFSFNLASTMDALAEARECFEEWLVDQEIDPQTIDELVVVLSELGANAVSAARVPGSVIAVRAWHDGAALVLEVENAQHSEVSGVIFHADTDPLRGSGHGLLIVTAYTDSVEVVPPDGNHGLVVRAVKNA